MFEWKLYLILGIQILFTVTLSGEWVYEGIENQKFITYRTFFVQLAFILAVFFFVKSSEDYLKYVLFLSVLNPISALINFYFFKNQVKIGYVSPNKLSIAKHFKFVLIIFAAQITALIYTQSAITIIGIFDDMKSVGYYGMASKFFRLSIVLWSAFAGSLIPRLTYLWANNDKEKYIEYANKILSLVVIVSVFISFTVFSLSEPIINIFVGGEFYKSILTLKIMSFGIFGSALAYFLGIIILYSQKNEKKFLHASVFAALLNVLLNLTAIKFADYNAVAFVTVITEYICFFYLIVRFNKHYKGIKIFSNSSTIKCLVAGIVSGYIASIAIKCNSDSIVQIIIGFLVGSSVYTVLLILLRHSYLKTVLLGLRNFF
jgi:O-antigen/teichoic acid export membrane protein